MFDYSDILSPDDIAKSLPQCSPTAIIARGAEIDASVKIGPSACVGGKVKLDKGVQIGPGAVVDGDTYVGEETAIHPCATVGTVPQDLKFAGENTQLRIGKRNQIREYVNISIGTKTGNNVTVIGDDNLFMAYTHIAHDCIIGNHTIFANGVQVAGHVEVSDHCVFGGLAGIHQFSKVGEYAMTGAGAIVVKDIPPYTMVQGDRAKPIGLNVVGLRRSPFGKDAIKNIKAMYRIVYSENLSVEDACARIESDVPDGREKKVFLDFLKNCDRGIVR